MKLIGIIIEFASLETVTIAQEHINAIHIDGLRECVRINDEGSVRRCKSCENIKISLKPSAKSIRAELDGVEGIGLSHRLSYPDIKEIGLLYEDGTSELIIVPQKTNDSELNHLQSTFETSTELFLTIGD